MIQQILRADIKKEIKKDKELQYKIITVNKGKNSNSLSFRTLERWLRTDYEKLTSATTLQVIRLHLKLPGTEILTVEKNEVIDV